MCLSPSGLRNLLAYLFGPRFHWKAAAGLCFVSPLRDSKTCWLNVWVHVSTDKYVAAGLCFVVPFGTQKLVGLFVWSKFPLKRSSWLVFCSPIPDSCSPLRDTSALQNVLTSVFCFLCSLLCFVVPRLCALVMHRSHASFLTNS